MWRTQTCNINAVSSLWTLNLRFPPPNTITPILHRTCQLAVFSSCHRVQQLTFDSRAPSLFPIDVVFTKPQSSWQKEKNELGSSSGSRKKSRVYSITLSDRAFYEVWEHKNSHAHRLMSFSKHVNWDNKTEQGCLPTEKRLSVNFLLNLWLVSKQENFGFGAPIVFMTHFFTPNSCSAAFWFELSKILPRSSSGLHQYSYSLGQQQQQTESNTPIGVRPAKLK